MLRRIRGPCGTAATAGCVAAGAAARDVVVPVRAHRVLGYVLRYGIPGGIALSRIYRGQHHISDTIAGVALGRWSAAVVRRELQ